jgi:hypothetical protein
MATGTTSSIRATRHIDRPTCPSEGPNRCTDTVLEAAAESSTIAAPWRIQQRSGRSAWRVGVPAGRRRRRSARTGAGRRALCSGGPRDSGVTQRHQDRSFDSLGWFARRPRTQCPRKVRSWCNGGIPSTRRVGGLLGRRSPGSTELVTSLTIQSYPDSIAMSIPNDQIRSVDATSARCRFEIQPVEQVVERAVVDHPRHVTVERWLGDPKRADVEPLVEHTDS